MSPNLRRFPLVLLILCPAFAALPGCAAYPRVPCPPRVTPALGEPRDGYGVVQLLFATDRRVTGAAQPALMFGVERSRSLTYGRCEISIPENHRLGGMEFTTLLRGGDPVSNLRMLSAEITDRPKIGTPPPTFIEELRRRVQLSPRKEIFVFVHGYAATFDESARITAQLAHDMRFDGVPILYTWPTQGLFLSYLVDSANAEWTVPYFVEFLDTLVRESGAERIHLMAHSMGTRVLARGLRDYAMLHGQFPSRYAPSPSAAAESPETATSDPLLAAAADPSRVASVDPQCTSADSPAFDQVILAAADIDAEIFERDYVPALLLAARRTTIYMSSKDAALGISLRLNGYFRLGQSDLPNVDLAALKRIDVVDVTDFDRDFLGHFYHNRCPRVLEDLAAVLHTPAAPPDLATPADGDTPEIDKPARRLQRSYYYRMKP